MHTTPDHPVTGRILDDLSTADYLAAMRRATDLVTSTCQTYEVRPRTLEVFPGYSSSYAFEVSVQCAGVADVDTLARALGLADDNPRHPNYGREQVVPFRHLPLKVRAYCRRPDTAAPATEGVHQPRERAVPCAGCGRPTTEYHARCAPCGGAVCNRCDPGNSPAALAARGPAVTSEDTDGAWVVDASGHNTHTHPTRAAAEAEADELQHLLGFRPAVHPVTTAAAQAAAIVEVAR